MQISTAIVILFSFYSLTYSKGLLPGLVSETKNVVQMLNEVAQIKNSYQGHTKPDLPYTNDFKNIKSFLDTLDRQVEPIGSGQFGSVYNFNGFLSESQKLPIMIVGKEILVDKDSSQKKAKEEQGNLIQEIQLNKQLMSLDENHLFFPTYFQTYDLTDYYHNVINKKQETNLVLDDKSANFLIIMEYLDLEYFELADQIFGSMVSLKFLTRLRMAENLAMGVAKIVSEFTHCDLKYENVMLKKISKEMANQQKEIGGLQKLELFPDEYYQIKIIDMGLSVRGSRQSRKCKGGSPDYAAIDYLKSNANDTVDVFALAVMMLGIELMSIDITPFNTVHGIAFSWNQKKTLTKKNKDTYVETEYPDYISTFATEEETHELFYAKVRSFYPEFDTFLSQNYRNKDLSKLDPAVFLYHNKELFYALNLACLHVLFDHVYKEMNEKHVQQLTESNTQRQGILDKMNDTEDESYKRKVDSIKYVEHMITLKNAQHKYLMQMVDLAIKVISTSANTRMKVEEYLEALNVIRDSYEKEFDEDLKFVHVYERHYKKRNQESQPFSIDSDTKMKLKHSPSFILDQDYRILI